MTIFKSKRFKTSRHMKCLFCKKEAEYIFYEEDLQCKNCVVYFNVGNNKISNICFHIILNKNSYSIILSLNDNFTFILKSKNTFFRSYVKYFCIYQVNNLLDINPDNVLSKLKTILLFI